MRYPKDQKQATRQRILEAAGRRFKQDGIDGAGVAAVMSDAGLTNGAFYAHFASKEDLVANVLADQLRAQRESFRAAPSDRAGLESFIRAYLSPEHRDQSADGCPSAALLDEIARRPAAHKGCLHRRTPRHRRRHRGAPGAERRRRGANRRAHAPRTHDRHPAARQGADRPRPVRSAPRPGRGDGLEAARRPRVVHAGVTTPHRRAHRLMNASVVWSISRTTRATARGPGNGSASGTRATPAGQPGGHRGELGVDRVPVDDPLVGCVREGQFPDVSGASAPWASRHVGPRQRDASYGRDASVVDRQFALWLI